ncbi:signal peptide peptidase SppA [Hippea alviniae]|uniref:signal peptide peptidase SppA n=1 Tax=Hippea alviniae TaxID=1279027 RepID=UPI0003B460F7|nr:signal peptide peptidase SppA [Hippea alviniae]
MAKKIIKYAVGIFVFIFIANVVYFSSKKSNVALIKIDGLITSKKANEIIKSINRAVKSANIKAILIKINSGGGEAVASQRLFIAIKKASKKKFTIALIEDVGASGAYYAACGAGKIISYPASIIGSIGVIFETINVSELAKRLGVSLFVVKTGKVKDVGNPFRKPTEEDKKMIQNLLNSVYEQFLNAVSSSRHIPLNKLKQIADGSVFTGNEALKLKLIDSTGGLNKAKELIRKKIDEPVSFENFNPKESSLSKLLNETYDYLEIISKPTIKMMAR